MSRAKDYVGLLEGAFKDQIRYMLDVISAIERDAIGPGQVPEPGQITFQQIPTLAEQIVRKSKAIDNLIDEANQETCIGKDIGEIKHTLAQKSAEYKESVQSLSRNCEEAKVWIDRINDMLNVIASNAFPWMQQDE